jgi:hypothetical protein
MTLGGTLLFYLISQTPSYLQFDLEELTFVGAGFGSKIVDSGLFQFLEYLKMFMLGLKELFCPKSHVY